MKSRRPHFPSLSETPRMMTNSMNPTAPDPGTAPETNLRNESSAENRLPASATANSTERGKRPALLFSLALIGAVLWPIQENWREDPHDSFPLTYYPMFSARRDPVEVFYYVVARDAAGQRHFVPYGMIGDGGLNQVRKQLNRKVREGRAGEVAQAVAATLARRARAPWSQIESVEVCWGKYAVDDYFRGKKEPVMEKIKASAPVRRTPP